jgi:SAM-dependent methyltransferase
MRSGSIGGMPDGAQRDVFDRSAPFYFSARPSYPTELFDDVVTISGVTPPGNLLEIGAGPGTATVDMARRGFRITALELGPQLAQRARLNLAAHPGVSVVTASFEEWAPPPAASYDLIYAANAWHWLDPSVRWAKTASVLRPGGYLAIFGASHAFPEGFDPFFIDLQAVYSEIGEGIDDWHPSPPQLTDGALIDEAEASGHFHVVERRLFVWGVRYDADGYLRLLDTFSNHIVMEPAKREYLYAEVRRRLAQRVDGQLTRHWQSQLAVFQQLPSA